MAYESVHRVFNLLFVLAAILMEGIAGRKLLAFAWKHSYEWLARLRCTKDNVLYKAKAWGDAVPCRVRRYITNQLSTKCDQVSAHFN